MAVKEFQPQLTKQQTQQYVSHYYKFPHVYDEDRKSAIEAHATHYNLPFYKEDTTGLKGLLQQATSGYLSGLTTFNMGPAPGSTAEGIARSVGHLAGFAGMTPAAPLKAMGITGSGIKALEAMRGVSVPMLGSKFVLNKAKSLLGTSTAKAITGRADATKTAANFLSREVVKDAAEGAAHLGVASAISSWQGGIDDMLTSGAYGAVTGGGFRVIGNLIKGGDPQGDKILRGIAGSLFDGLPSTMRGETTPEQIYSYLLGAYFGYNETPVEAKLTARHLNKMYKEKKFDPEQIEGWDLLPETSKKEVKKKVDSLFKDASIFSNVLIGDLDKGLYEKILKANTPEGFEMKGFDEKTGKPLLELTPEAKDIQKSKLEKPKEKFANEDQAENAQESEFTQPTQVLQRSVNFVERKFENNKRVQKLEPLEKAVEMHRLASEIDKTIKINTDNQMNLRAKDRVNNTDKIVEQLQDKLQIGFELQDKAFIRTHVDNLLHGVPTRVMSAQIDENGKLSLVHLRNGETPLGNNRNNRDPLKLIEEVYIDSVTNLVTLNKEVHDADGISEKGERPLAMHDHFIVRDKNGKLLELEPGQFKNYLLRRYDYDRNIVEKEYDKATSEIFDQMAKNNYLYIGGRGDNKRNFFIKEHPEVRRIIGKKSKNGELSIVSTIQRAYGKKSKFRKAYYGFRKEFYKRYPNASENLFDRMFINNIVYEAKLNGFDVLNPKGNLTNLSKLVDKNFVNDPISINKRMQIWLTNGIPGDKKFLRDRLDFSHNKDVEIVYEPSKKRRSGKDALTDDIVPAYMRTYQDGTKKIFIDKKELKKKFDQKSWTNPKVKGVKALPRDQFKTYEDFERFVIEHEKAHTVILQKKGESTGDYENRINEAALNVDNLKYEILADAPKLKVYNEKTKATEYVEATDGAILVHDNVVDALAEMTGIAEGTTKNTVGQIKSFIVSKDSKNGTLLGKYMIHSAGPELSKKMEAKGLHMQIYDSSIKQKGFRKYGETYNLDPRDMKGIASEKTDSHNAKPARLPKQMFSNLTAFSSMLKNPKEAQETIDKMFDEFIGESFRGDSIYNEKLLKLIENPGDKKLADELINNMESLGVQELMDAIKHPDLSYFTAKAYTKMLRVAQENVDALLSEGELNDIEVKNTQNAISEFRSSLERMVKNSEEGKLGPWIHKRNLGMLNAAKRAYTITKVTKPVMKNSIAARMRPYDHQMRTERAFKELETRDDIFYLDEGFKEAKVELDAISGFKGKTLGQLWEHYQAGNFKGDTKKEVENYFEAISMRVPMDSVSGAHKLKFKGFTGRKGHGIVLHPRSMRAQGGADLDGDKSWVFFGWKPEYKKLYHDHKKEFYTEVEINGKKVPKIPDAKEDIVTRGPNKGKTYRSLFVQEANEFEKKIAQKIGVDPGELYKSDLLKFLPNARKNASDGASFGRDMLGTAVTIKAKMQSKHSELMNMIGQREVIEKFDKKGNKYYIEMTPKKDPKDWDHFKRASRAMIALGSDPMDEPGLKGYDTFFNESFDALFNVRVEKHNKEDGKVSEISLKKNPWIQGWLGHGVYKTMENINKAYWGKNALTDKSYTSSEIDNLINYQDIHSLPGQSYLTKVGKLLQPVDFSEGIFQRIDPTKVEKMYQDFDEVLKNLIDGDKFQNLQQALGRTSLGISKKSKELMKKTTDFVFENKMWSAARREIMAKDDNAFFRIAKEMGIKENEYLKITDPNYRKNIIDRYYKRAEDFIINDITDMATFKNVWDIITSKSIEMSKVEEMSKHIEALKKISYLNNIRAKEFAQKSFGKTMDQELFDMRTALYEQYVEKGIDHLLPAEDQVMKTAGEKTSKSKSQVEIDNEIRRYKDRLTNEEKKLYDAIMLGSFTRDNNKTATSGLGFASKAIPDASIASFMKKFNDTFELSDDSSLYNEGKEVIDKVVDSTKDTFIEEPSEVIDELAPFRGIVDLKKPRVTELKDKEEIAMYNRIKDNLNYFHNHVGKSIDTEAKSPKKDLNEFIRGIVFKDINAMNMEDWRVVDRFLDDMRQGPAIAGLYRKIVGKDSKLPKWWHWAFPRTVSRDMIRKDLLLLEKNGIYYNKDGVEMEGKYLQPVSTLTAMQEVISKTNDMSGSHFLKLREDFDDDFKYLDGIPEGGGLWEIAVRGMEMKLINHPNPKYRLDANTELGRYYISIYRKNMKEAEKTHKWAEIKDKKFNIASVGPDGKPFRKQITGQEVVNDITTKMTNRNKKFYENIVKGNEKYIEKYAVRDKKTDQIKWYDKEANDPVLNVDKFVNDMIKKIHAGEDIPKDMGLDFLRKLSRQMMIDLGARMGRGDQISKLLKLPIADTGQFPFEAYYPHLMMDKKVSKANIKKAYEIIMKGSGSQEEKLNRVRQLVMKYHNNTGEWSLEMTDNEHWNAWDDAVSKIAENRSNQEVVKTLDVFRKPGNLHSRTGHMDGWSISPEAYHSYMKGVSDSYHRQVSQLLSRNLVDQFYFNNKNKLGEDLTNGWQQFLKLYAQDSMGYPSVIPRRYMDNPTLNVKGTPYAWWADNIVKKRFTEIKKKLGIKGDAKIPEELREITTSDIRNWTNLEAKFQLMSLLAHPKTAVGNLYGGTAHTIASTGLENFRLGRNVDWLSTHFSPDIKSLEDVQKLVSKHGVIEEYLIKEAGFNDVTKDAKFRSFFKEATAKISKDPKYDDSSLMGLAKKHGVSDSIFRKAAWFMRTSERTLRRDAFMAHLVQAWKDFGSTLPYDHPFLIERAKKGVQATQFLYSAPFRPAFSRTALGKVMTRFQLWGWNAIDFRKEVYRQAKIRGFREGTEEFNRLRRTMGGDLFMLGLGTAFSYSLFEAALPPPWSWLQDTAGLLFGDEKDRDRAFFGQWPTPLAPLQIVTPPILRLPVQSMTAFFNGSWDKVASYTIPTMFPFGRVARDAYGIFQNPMFFAEKFTGLPVLQLQRDLKKQRKEELFIPSQMPESAKVE